MDVLYSTGGYFINYYEAVLLVLFTHAFMLVLVSALLLFMVISRIYHVKYFQSSLRKSDLDFL
jgi:hypothetical protein